jgi:hypothetical protein
MAMSEEPRRKSHALWWGPSLLLAVPLLYVLSVPPLAAYRWRHKLGPFSSGDPRAPAVRAYYQPWIWLHDNTVLKKPMDDYFHWYQQFSENEDWTFIAPHN